jgi:hypothetical protein
VLLHGNGVEFDDAICAASLELVRQAAVRRRCLGHAIDMRSVALVVDAARYDALGLEANDAVQVTDLRVVTYGVQVINPREGLLVDNVIAELARVALDGPNHEVELLAVALEG